MHSILDWREISPANVSPVSITSNVCRNPDCSRTEVGVERGRGVKVGDLITSLRAVL